MPHRIKVEDKIGVREVLDTYKRWFNGAKHFITVKLLPPKR